MRARRPHTGARERLRAWLVELDELYGDVTKYGEVARQHYAEQLARLDRGEPVRFHAWEVDLTPVDAYLEIDADGRVTVVAP